MNMKVNNPECQKEASGKCAAGISSPGHTSCAGENRSRGTSDRHLPRGDLRVRVKIPHRRADHVYKRGSENADADKNPGRRDLFPSRKHDAADFGPAASHSVQRPARDRNRLPDHRAFSSYPFTSGKLLLIYTGLFLLAGLLIGAAAILLSRVLNNVIAAGGVICFTVLADLFLTIPPKFSVLSQIRFLTPLQVLVNSSMADPRLVRIGSTYLTVFQIAGILYVMLILALSFGTIAFERK